MYGGIQNSMGEKSDEPSTELKSKKKHLISIKISSNQKCFLKDKMEHEISF